MAIHYLTGSDANNNSSVIANVEATTRSDVTSVKPLDQDLKSDGTASVVSDTSTTIQQAAGGSVTAIVGVDGYVGVNIGAAPTIGSTLDVVGADYPFEGTYLVTGASGNVALTSTPYVDCTGISNYGTYTSNAGDFDPASQREFMIVGYTNEIGGQANEALRCHKKYSSESLHKFQSYRSRVYADCWECFAASGNTPCVTTTVVTLADDQAADGVPTVILQVGCADGTPKAADLENPDTTGLRAPA